MKTCTYGITWLVALVGLTLTMPQGHTASSRTDASIPLLAGERVSLSCESAPTCPEIEPQTCPDISDAVAFCHEADPLDRYRRPRVERGYAREVFVHMLVEATRPTMLLEVNGIVLRVVLPSSILVDCRTSGQVYLPPDNRQGTVERCRVPGFTPLADADVRACLWLADDRLLCSEGGS